MDLAIIIGAMKSGTTSLFNHLAAHPQIAPCRVKEPNFFSDDRRWRQGLDWYRGLFPWDSDQHRWALEASTAYTKSSGATRPWQRMNSVPGDKRLIYVMRDPIERIESGITYGRLKRWPSFEFPGGDIPSKVVGASRYAQRLRPYWETFGADRVLLVLFEDLIADPGGVVDATCGFLDIASGLDLGDLSRAHNVSSEQRVRPQWYSRAQSHPAVRWLRRRTPARQSIARVLPGFRKIRRFELDTHQRNRLLEELKPDLLALRDEFGVDISRWGYDF